MIQALRDYHLTVGQGLVDMRDDFVRLGLARESQMDELEASVGRLAAREVDRFLEVAGDA